MNQPPSRKAKWREKKEAADGKGGFYTLKPPPTSEEAKLCVWYVHLPLDPLSPVDVEEEE